MSALEFSFSDYGSYMEHDFRHRWLRPHLLREKLEKYRRSNRLSWEITGYSEEGRPIEHIQFGSGPVKILAWSQMHGNEPTATMALIDILNFLIHEDTYNAYRKMLSDHFTILMIPMLNPDGAERFTRRNAFQIDPNRDAVSWQTAEMKVFKKVFDHFKPHWAFNLHDQRNFFSAGNSNRTATISFLSASADEERTLTAVRKKSMQLIGALWKAVNSLCQGHFGRYTDEFYPRALGEFFHAQGIPCILIESGTYPNDYYRDKARQLNFCLLLKALELIQNESYSGEDIQTYLDIPENGKSLLDHIIRSCIIYNNGKTISADLGFMYQESVDHQKKELSRKLILTDVGDLSFQFGLEEEEGGVIAQPASLKLDKPAHFKIQVSGKDIQFENGHRNEKYKPV